MSYSRGWDHVYRDIKLTDEADRQRSDFAQQVDHRSNTGSASPKC